MDILKTLRNLFLLVAVLLALLAILDIVDVWRGSDANSDAAIATIALFVSLMIAPTLLLAGVFQALFLVFRHYNTKKIQRQLDPEWWGMGI